jgi:hypothetical protein
MQLQHFMIGRIWRTTLPMHADAKTPKRNGVEPFLVSDSANGFHTIIVEDYEDFATLFGGDYFRDYPEYVFRGHRDPSYVTLPTLYREFNTRYRLRAGASNSDRLDHARRSGFATAKMLRHFLYGIRGTPWQEEHHDRIIEWFEKEGGAEPHIEKLRKAAAKESGLWSAVLNTWALGQHYGLFTPLLDWSDSMLVALYFAFSESDERASGEEHREVYALNRRLVETRCQHPNYKKPTLDFIAPFVRKNPRLLAQQGLFTYSHENQSVTEWVTNEFTGDDGQLPVLIRILIKNEAAQEAARWMNRAGTSDRTIYPDLSGITKFSNRALHDDKLSYT